MASTMSAQQLAEAGKQLQKAFEGGDPPSTLLGLLKPLESFTATELLLRQSKIGVAVGKLRQSKDPKVVDSASRLVNQWKRDVQKKSGTSSPAPAGATARAHANGAVNGRAGTSSPAPGSVKKEVPQRKSKVPPEKRNADADEVKTDITGNATRDGCLKLIYNGLAFMSEEYPDEILAVAKNVEYAAYNEYQPETSTTYKSKVRSLFMNLKMKENTDLRADVFSGKIAPKRFVTMTSDELKSAEKRKEDAKLEKENMSKAMTAQEEKAISTTMTCGKCRQSRVAYSQAQTRSADEPMTTFCECTNCGHRWKFS